MLFLAACSGGGGSGTGSGTASTGWSAVGSADFTSGEADFTSLALDSDTPYVAYSDFSNGGKATVEKFDGSTWSVVGSQGFSTNGAYYTSLAIGPGGAPYVAYQDTANSFKLTVKSFNGSSWQDAGNPDFSAGEADVPTLAMGPSGVPVPYVAYSDNTKGHRATVQNLSAGAWSPVGPAGFSSGAVHVVSLAIDSNGTPYIAYIQVSDWKNDTSGTLIVEKFVKSSWSVVGTAASVATNARVPVLAIGPSDVPYVAYEDAAASDKATVEKYNSASQTWETVGSRDFTAGAVKDPSFAIDGTGTPYLAYADGVRNHKATVEKFNGTDWVYVGSPGFTPGAAAYDSLALDSTGIPYLAYQDSTAQGNSKATVQRYTGP